MVKGLLVNTGGLFMECRHSWKLLFSDRKIKRCIRCGMWKIYAGEKVVYLPPPSALRLRASIKNKFAAVGERGRLLQFFKRKTPPAEF
jgi:hypothetical protein